MNIYFRRLKNCFRLQFKQLFPCHATLDRKFLIYQFTTVPFKPFIYRFTTVIKYNPQNLQNLEFPNPAKPAKPTKARVPIPFKPLFNSRWYMFLNQWFDSQQYSFIDKTLNCLIFINNYYLYACTPITICIL